MNKIYQITFTNVFKKQYSKIKNDPKFKQEEFDKVIKLLSTNQVLPQKYKNHLLNPKSKRNMGMSFTKWYFTRIPKTWRWANIIISGNRYTL